MKGKAITRWIISYLIMCNKDKNHVGQKLGPTLKTGQPFRPILRFS